MNEAKQQKNPHHQQHIPLDDLIVTDLHSHIPIDVDRLTQMAADYSAGSSWAIHPVAQVWLTKRVDRLKASARGRS